MIDEKGGIPPPGPRPPWRLSPLPYETVAKFSKKDLEVCIGYLSTYVEGVAQLQFDICGKVQKIIDRYEPREKLE